MPTNKPEDTNTTGCCGTPSKPEPVMSSCCSEPTEQNTGSCCDEPSGQNHEPSACCGDDDIVANTDGTASVSCCTPGPQSPFKRWMNRLSSVWALIALIPLVILALDPDRIMEVLTIAISALGGTAPYIIIAVLMIGYLKATGAENMVAKAFVGRETRMIFFAAFFGGLAPFCSCEVIPFVAGLLAVGAPLSAVMAFWLSSPLIDPPSLLITAGALGWDFAIGKAIAAVALGIFGGFGVRLLLRKGVFQSPLRNEPATSCCDTGGCNVDDPYSERPRWKFWKDASRTEIFKQESLKNALFLFKWLSLAYLLEALLILYVPANLIGGIVGGEGLGPIVLGALVGMPAYLNSYAAPPLVSGLMEQGMSAGSAMAFMVAGSISSIPAMAAVFSLVKKPVFAAYLIFGITGAILFGILFAAVV